MVKKSFTTAPLVTMLRDFQGIKSVARPLLTGHPDVPRDTGDVAYRIVIPGSELLKHPDLESLITEPATTSWCGPEAHIVGYPIRDGELYNIVVCATSRGETTDEVWVVKGDNTELRQRFSSWELPYLAQGAAQAVEDAAVLRQCLAAETDLAVALKKYETIRVPRASLIQSKTREHQYILHIDDGEEQKERDARMSKDAEENPMFWGYEERRNWLFSHDAENIQQDGANWKALSGVEARL